MQITAGQGLQIFRRVQAPSRQALTRNRCLLVFSCIATRGREPLYPPLASFLRGRWGIHKALSGIS
jgi:hypothetical protein